MNIYRLYALVSPRFRVRRLRRFYAVCGVNPAHRLLDVGGSASFWQLAHGRQLPLPQVTILNLHDWTGPLPPRTTWVTGDGTRIPFSDQSFDFVFCNSVIEHVGPWSSQADLAAEIRRVGKGYFVQTPDKRFPLELHLLTPFVHWLPRRVRARLVPRWTLRYWLARPSAQEIADLASIHLLGCRQMRALFPDATLEIERVAGWPKAIIAYRKPRD